MESNECTRKVELILKEIEGDFLKVWHAPYNSLHSTYCEGDLLNKINI